MRRRTVLEIVASVVGPVAVVAVVVGGGNGHVASPGAAGRPGASGASGASGLPAAQPASTVGATWSIASPAEPEVPDGTLAAVSCPTAEWCSAVGTYDGPGGRGLTLAEVRSGGRWTITSSPSPAGAADAALNAVSCVSRVSCVAVGHTTGAGGSPTALAEIWDGRRWAAVDTAVVGNAVGSGLYGVSCAGPSSCVAVGADGSGGGADGEVPLIEVWNGTSWHPVAAAPGAHASQLFGVSCWSPRTCMAVGASSSAAGLPSAIAEQWDGRAWRRVDVAAPTSSATTALESVSCTSSARCEAVGNASDDSGSEAALLEGWDGRAWGPQIAGGSGGAATPHSLASVSCPTPTRCLAVGTHDDATTDPAPSVAEWDGSVWHVDDLAGPATGPATNAAAATAPTHTALPTPGGTGSSSGTGTELGAVSCPGTRTCLAVGDTSRRSGAVTASERWDGATWSPVSTPDPPGVATSALDAVSCTSPSDCTAVGDTVDADGREVPLAEEWNGRRWTVEPTPAPGDAVGSALYGVSCPDADSCVAVGASTLASDAEVSLAEVWNGSTWTIVASPGAAGATTSALGSVSCPALHICAAVGATTGPAGAQIALAESWDGATWQIQDTPETAGATSGDLYAVTCASPGQCRASGVTTDAAGTSRALAEIEVAGRWRLAAPTGPQLAAPGSLHGQWCAAAAAATTATAAADPPAVCIGVGSSTGASDSSGAAAAVWDGRSWQSRPVGMPLGATSGSLSGVSCTAPGACVAVGTWSDGSGTVLALTEVWHR